MIRVLLFFALLFAVALGFTWLADVPGTISIEWVSPDPAKLPISWEQPPAVVAVVVGILLAIFLAIVWVVRVILKSPHIASRFFQRRRKDKGYTALSQGLIALGTGNAKQARRQALEADRLLADEPAARLLLAQTAQLAGKDDEARQRFEAMLEDPETRALGLHGLFVEAERHREPVAARHYAEEAAKTSPGLEWAGKAVLGYQAVAHHWDEALKSLERNYAAKLLDKKTYRRQRAVILTALAQDLESGEPERAYSLAKEAHGLALDLVPAAVLTSRLATRRGDIRKAAKVLEATWRLFPHPELAETYAHVRTGDSAVDRLKRVKSLAAQRANSPEGALAVARAALEAREFEDARAQLKKLLQSEPSRQAFMLMAEVEEAEHGDRGRVRDWLSRAVKAPLDKAWVADGIISAEWQAVSPVTGKLDAFEWRTPAGLTGEGADVLEDSLFDAPVLSAPSPMDTQTAAASVVPPDDAKTLDIEPEPAAPAKAATADPTERAPEPVKVAAASAASPKSGYEGTTDDVKFAPALKDLPDVPEGDPASVEAKADAPKDSGVGTGKTPDGDPEPAAKQTGKLETGKPEYTEAAENGSDKPSSDAASEKAGDTPAPDTGPDTSGAAKPAEASQPEPEKPDTGKADPGKPAVSKTDAAKTSAAKSGASSQSSDLNRPIEFPLSRMPDDPGPDEDEEDNAAKAARPRFFN